MIKVTAIACLAAVALVAATPASAGDTTLRIATVAPAGSSFHKSLQALAAEWSKAPEIGRAHV